MCQFIFIFIFVTNFQIIVQNKIGCGIESSIFYSTHFPFQWKKGHQCHKVDHPFPNRNLPERHKKIQRKEYQEEKKTFEARLWEAVKFTQSYSGESSGSFGSKV